MDIKGYNIPEDLYYDENHFWYKPEGEELVMGMDDFAQKLAGEVVYVQLPADGKKVKKGKKLAKVESGKWLGKIISPVDGEIAEVNEELETDPGLINKDPYDEGWMYRLKVADMSVLDELIHGEEAITKFIEAEIEKYKDQL
jgi:glycine cleavage system H protein